MLNCKKILLTPFFLFLIFNVGLPVYANLDRQQIQEIYTALGAVEFEDFFGFLAAVAESPATEDAARDVSRSYMSGGDLNLEQRNILYRLLGIYTRLEYGEQAMATLKQLVAIPTFEIEGVPQHENSNFHQFAEALGAIAEEFDLDFRYVDERVYEITLHGSGDELVGFHALHRL